MYTRTTFFLIVFTCTSTRIRYLERTEKESGLLELSGRELPEARAENRTQVLCKSNTLLNISPTHPVRNYGKI